MLNSLPEFEGALSSCSTKVSCTPNLILCISIYFINLTIKPSNLVNNNNFLSAGYSSSKSISIYIENKIYKFKKTLKIY